jgi:signal peptidase II
MIGTERSPGEAIDIISESGPADGDSKAGLMGLLTLAGLVFALDQITKALVARQLEFGETLVFAEASLGRVFRLHHARNTGLAFGMFQGNNDLFLILSIAIVLILLAFAMRLPVGDRLSRAAIGMQVGGALGNAVDRMRLGYVTDFLDFFVGTWHWPTFNVADSAIVVGVGLLMFRIWTGGRVDSTSV